MSQSESSTPFEFKKLDLNSQEALNVELAIYINSTDLCANSHWEKKALWEISCKDHYLRIFRQKKEDIIRVSDALHPHITVKESYGFMSKQCKIPKDIELGLPEKGVHLCRSISALLDYCDEKCRPTDEMIIVTIYKFVDGPSYPVDPGANGEEDCPPTPTPGFIAHVAKDDLPPAKDPFTTKLRDSLIYLYEAQGNASLFPRHLIPQAVVMYQPRDQGQGMGPLPALSAMFSQIGNMETILRSQSVHPTMPQNSQQPFQVPLGPRSLPENQRQGSYQMTNHSGNNDSHRSQHSFVQQGPMSFPYQHQQGMQQRAPPPSYPQLPVAHPRPHNHIPQSQMSPNISQQQLRAQFPSFMGQQQGVLHQQRMPQQLQQQQQQQQQHIQSHQSTVTRQHAGHHQMLQPQENSFHHFPQQNVGQQQQHLMQNMMQNSYAQSAAMLQSQTAISHYPHHQTHQHQHGPPQQQQHEILPPSTISHNTQQHSSQHQRIPRQQQQPGMQPPTTLSRITQQQSHQHQGGQQQQLQPNLLHQQGQTLRLNQELQCFQTGNIPTPSFSQTWNQPNQGLHSDPLLQSVPSTNQVQNQSNSCSSGTQIDRSQNKTGVSSLESTIKNLLDHPDLSNSVELKQRVSELLQQCEQQKQPQYPASNTTSEFDLPAGLIVIEPSEDAEPAQGANSHEPEVSQASIVSTPLLATHPCPTASGDSQPASKVLPTHAKESDLPSQWSIKTEGGRASKKWKDEYIDLTIDESDGPDTDEIGALAPIAEAPLHCTALAVDAATVLPTEVTVPSNTELSPPERHSSIEQLTRFLEGSDPELSSDEASPSTEVPQGETEASTSKACNGGHRSFLDAFSQLENMFQSSETPHVPLQNEEPACADDIETIETIRGESPLLVGGQGQGGSQSKTNDSLLQREPQHPQRHCESPRLEQVVQTQNTAAEPDPSTEGLVKERQEGALQIEEKEKESHESVGQIKEEVLDELQEGHHDVQCKNKKEKEAEKAAMEKRMQRQMALAEEELRVYKQLTGLWPDVDDDARNISPTTSDGSIQGSPPLSHAEQQDAEVPLTPSDGDDSPITAEETHSSNSVDGSNLPTAAKQPISAERGNLPTATEGTGPPREPIQTDPSYILSLIPDVQDPEEDAYNSFDDDLSHSYEEDEQGRNNQPTEIQNQSPSKGEKRVADTEMDEVVSESPQKKVRTEENPVSYLFPFFNQSTEESDSSDTNAENNDETSMPPEEVNNDETSAPTEEVNNDETSAPTEEVNNDETSAPPEEVNNDERASTSNEKEPDVSSPSKRKNTDLGNEKTKKPKKDPRIEVYSAISMKNVSNVKQVPKRKSTQKVPLTIEIPAQALKNKLTLRPANTDIGVMRDGRGKKTAKKISSNHHEKKGVGAKNKQINSEKRTAHGSTRHERNTVKPAFGSTSSRFGGRTEVTDGKNSGSERRSNKRADQNVLSNGSNGTVTSPSSNLPAGPTSGSQDRERTQSLAFNSLPRPIPRSSDPPSLTIEKPEARVARVAPQQRPNVAVGASTDPLPNGSSGTSPGRKGGAEGIGELRRDSCGSVGSGSSSPGHSKEHKSSTKEREERREFVKKRLKELEYKRTKAIERKERATRDDRRKDAKHLNGLIASYTVDIHTLRHEQMKESLGSLKLERIPDKVLLPEERDSGLVDGRMPIYYKENVSNSVCHNLAYSIRKIKEFTNKLKEAHDEKTKEEFMNKITSVKKSRVNTLRHLLFASLPDLSTAVKAVVKEKSDLQMGLKDLTVSCSPKELPYIQTRLQGLDDRKRELRSILSRYQKEKKTIQEDSPSLPIVEAEPQDIPQTSLSTNPHTDPQIHSHPMVWSPHIPPPTFFPHFIPNFPAPMPSYCQPPPPPLPPQPPMPPAPPPPLPPSLPPSGPENHSNLTPETQANLNPSPNLDSTPKQGERVSAVNTVSCFDARSVDLPPTEIEMVEMEVASPQKSVPADRTSGVVNSVSNCNVKDSVNHPTIPTADSSVNHPSLPTTDVTLTSASPKNPIQSNLDGSNNNRPLQRNDNVTNCSEHTKNPVSDIGNLEDECNGPPLHECDNAVVSSDMTVKAVHSMEGYTNRRPLQTTVKASVSRSSEDRSKYTLNVVAPSDMEVPKEYPNQIKPAECPEKCDHNSSNIIEPAIVENTGNRYNEACVKVANAQGSINEQDQGGSELTEAKVKEACSYITTSKNNRQADSQLYSDVSDDEEDFEHCEKSVSSPVNCAENEAAVNYESEKSKEAPVPQPASLLEEQTEVVATNQKNTPASNRQSVESNVISPKDSKITANEETEQKDHGSQSKSNHNIDDSVNLDTETGALGPSSEKVLDCCSPSPSAGMVLNSAQANNGAKYNADDLNGELLDYAFGMDISPEKPKISKHLKSPCMSRSKSPKKQRDVPQNEYRRRICRSPKKTASKGYQHHARFYSKNIRKSLNIEKASKRHIDKSEPQRQYREEVPDPTPEDQELIDVLIPSEGSDHYTLSPEVRSDPAVLVWQSVTVPDIRECDESHRPTVSEGNATNLQDELDSPSKPPTEASVTSHNEQVDINSSPSVRDIPGPSKLTDKPKSPVPSLQENHPVENGDSAKKSLPKKSPMKWPKDSPVEENKAKTQYSQPLVINVDGSDSDSCARRITLPRTEEGTHDEFGETQLPTPLPSFLSRVKNRDKKMKAIKFNKAQASTSSFTVKREKETKRKQPKKKIKTRSEFSSQGYKEPLRLDRPQVRCGTPRSASWSLSSSESETSPTRRTPRSASWSLSSSESETSPTRRTRTTSRNKSTSKDNNSNPSVRKICSRSRSRSSSMSRSRSYSRSRSRSKGARYSRSNSPRGRRLPRSRSRSKRSRSPSKRSWSRSRSRSKRSWSRSRSRSKRSWSRSRSRSNRSWSRSRSRSNRSWSRSRSRSKRSWSRSRSRSNRSWSRSRSQSRSRSRSSRHSIGRVEPWLYQSPKKGGPAMEGRRPGWPQPGVHRPTSVAAMAVTFIESNRQYMNGSDRNGEDCQGAGAGEAYGAPKRHQHWHL